jgi:hypothetical protein
MHPIINISELFIPMWHGTLRCDPPDNKASWDWATLIGDTWIEHGKFVAAATQVSTTFYDKTQATACTTFW